MTLGEAARLGISRVRLPRWSNPLDYLKLDIVQMPDGHYTFGPWVHLYAPIQSVIGEPTPQDIPAWGREMSVSEWEIYAGPRNEKDTTL
jgi:hypothetical protein